MKFTEDIAKRPERLENVPYTRIRGEELVSLCKLYASWDAVEKMLEDDYFTARVKTLPGGYRDLRMIRSKLEGMVNDLMHTIPREKVIGVNSAVRRMRFSVAQGPVASRDRHADEQIVKAAWIRALVEAAHGWKCIVCQSDCNRCELGKAMDNLIAEDRNGRSWSEISFELSACEHVEEVKDDGITDL